MKRVLAFILSTVMFITCIAAVSIAADAEVEAVIEAIKGIGIVTLQKADIINAAKSSFDLLTAEQKEQVTNYGVLEAAVERYNELYSTDWELEKATSRINGVSGMTKDSVNDDTVMKGVMIKFREVVDGDRRIGYSAFNDRCSEKLQSDKSFTYEYDVVVYDYDAVNGYPVLNGYTDGQSTMRTGMIS